MSVRGIICGHSRYGLCSVSVSQRGHAWLIDNQSPLVGQGHSHLPSSLLQFPLDSQPCSQSFSSGMKVFAWILVIIESGSIESGSSNGWRASDSHVPQKDIIRIKNVGIIQMPRQGTDLYWTH